MAGLDSATLNALQSLISNEEESIFEPFDNAELAKTSEVSSSINADIDPIAIGCGIASMVIGREVIDPKIPLRDQGATSLDIWAVVSRLEQDLCMHIKDERILPGVSISSLLTS